MRITPNYTTNIIPSFVYKIKIKTAILGKFAI